MILAIDPGNKESAYVLFQSAGVANAGKDRLVMFAKEPNECVLAGLASIREEFGKYGDVPLVIEKIASYGMAVGETVFETVFWSGRFAQVWHPKPVWRIERMKVKMNLCRHPRAKDSNIRQALIDRFGEPGTKAMPGMLYGVSKDVWAALAVAVTYADMRKQKRGLVAMPVGEF